MVISKSEIKKFFLIFVLFVFFFPVAARSEQVDIGVILSQRIVPYVESYKGFKQVISDLLEASITDYYLIYERENQSEKLKAVFSNKKVDLILGIGPSAASFIRSELNHLACKKIYTMVFAAGENRNKLPDCGIGLAISPEYQFREIAMKFPDIKRISLIYSKGNIIFEPQQYITAAENNGIRLTPYLSAEHSDIPGIINMNSNIDALLLIPDKIVTTTSIIDYIIHKCLNRGIPVIGFNKYFYERGALLSFIVDYYETGRRTGSLAAEILTKGRCPAVSCYVESLVNDNTATSLRINYNKKDGGAQHHD